MTDDAWSRGGAMLAPAVADAVLRMRQVGLAEAL